MAMVDFSTDKMTARERVRRAMRHEEPDRVPLNYSSNPGIDARLKAHFGLAAGDSGGLRQALGVDFRGIGAPYTGPRLHAEIPGRQVDPLMGSRCRWVEHASGGYWDFCDFPLADAPDDVIANWPMPSPDDFDYSAVRQQCAAHANFYLHVGHPGLGDIMNSTGFLRGMEATMMALGEQHEATLRLIDRRLALQLEQTRRILTAAEGRIDMMWLGEDLGSQRGPLISGDMFQWLVRPRLQRFVDLAAQFKIPVMVHSCGSSSWAYPYFIEMGISAVDTVQPEPVNMDLATLKRRFGRNLTFHGGISTAGPVAFGTVEETIACVKRTLEIMMPGGGYCCAPTHALQDNSPTENVLAFYRTAATCGRYR